MARFKRDVHPACKIHLKAGSVTWVSQNTDPDPPPRQWADPLVELVYDVNSVEEFIVTMETIAAVDHVEGRRAGWGETESTFPWRTDQ